MMLDRGDVAIIRIRLDQFVPAVHVLDDCERARASRFTFDRDRRRFVAAHAATREVLGKMLSISPSRVRFAVGRHGKPYLFGMSGAVRFNLSHSAERALLVVGLDRELGIDVEEMIPADHEGLAAAVFSTSERLALLRIAPHCQKVAFYRGWTRKESFVKAVGHGLAFPLAAFDVSLEPAGDQLLVACRVPHCGPERWTIRSVEMEPGYAAAVAVEGGGFEVISSDVDAFCRLGISRSP
jgi:4'-phosphopantetheinyl transferase